MKIASILLVVLLAPVIALADPVPAPAPVCPPPPKPLPACSFNGVDISADDAAIVAAIGAQEFCFQAVVFAEKCGSNQGGDIRFINAAISKCEARLRTLTPSQTDLNNLSNLKVACNRKWHGREGTQYQSINGFCKLRALSWMMNLLDENE